MSNQNNNSNETKNNANGNNNVSAKDTKNGGNNQNDFSGALSFCAKNVRYIAAAGLFVAVVVFLVKSSAGNAGTAPKDDTPLVATEAAPTETETESNEDYVKDAYPQINELVSNYYTAYANGDLDSLTALTENMSETEKSYITVFSEQVETYENISCYTKAGLDNTSYIVSVSLEMKFKDIETTAPGLDFFYVRTREDGSLYIDQRYSQFNLANEEQELEPEIQTLIEEFKQQE
ncbi:MAG: SH3 domain-containing protein, partial [Lachnospiraceae bacterium]|nr:SH3 domain-containing protein [Lachnospiraceae bacterium]